MVEQIVAIVHTLLETRRRNSLYVSPFHFAAGDSKSLKILLSFAVGGLLGDVFLHLLPEAWSADLSTNGNGT